jgi:hypothetical protein
MHNPLGVPIACGFFGSLFGLVAGCGECFPVIVGAGTGSSVGCVICIFLCIFDSPEKGLPVAKIVDSQPTLIQNVYIIDTRSTGAPKIIGTNTELDVPSM